MSLSQLIKKNNNEISRRTIIFVVILILFASLRKGIGTDYESYVLIYNNLPQNIEIGYKGLNILINKLGLGVATVFFISSCIMFINILKGLKRFKVDVGFAIFLYFCLYYLTHHYNIVRHGISASFVFVAMSLFKDKEYRKATFNLLLGSTFHIIAIFLLPVLLFANKKLSRTKFLVILFIGFILSRIDIVMPIVNIFNKYFSSSVFMYKLNYYLNDYYLNIGAEETSYGLSIGLIARIMILVFVISLPQYYKKRMYETNILLFGVVLMFILNSYGVFAERIVNVLYMIEIVILADVIYVFKKERFTRLIIGFIIVIYGTLFFGKLLSSVDLIGNYQYLPYRTIIYELFYK